MKKEYLIKVMFIMKMDVKDKENIKEETINFSVIR